MAEKNAETMRELQKGSIPITMTVGGCTYEILNFLRGNEKSVDGEIMAKRAAELNADLGKDDGHHLLKYQDEIPSALQRKVIFIFPNWRHPVCPGFVCYVYWHGDRWVGGWSWLIRDFSGDCRVLRRK